MSIEKDKILISVPIERKPYYDSDVIQSLLRDNQIAYKKGDTFILMSIRTEKARIAINKIIKGEMKKDE